MDCLIAEDKKLPILKVELPIVDQLKAEEAIQPVAFEPVFNTFLDESVANEPKIRDPRVPLQRKMMDPLKEIKKSIEELNKGITSDVVEPADSTAEWVVDEMEKEGMNNPWQQLNNFTRFLWEYVHRDMDMLLPITAFKGVGKSTFSLQLMRRYMNLFKEQVDPTIKLNLKEQVVYTLEEMGTKLQDAKEYMIINGDEAARWAMGEDWMYAGNKEIKRRFVQVRRKHLVVLACLPDFFWLDSKYRNSMVPAWIHIIRRGTAILFFPDERVGIEDRWHRKEFEKMPFFNRWTPLSKIMKHYKKHPCYQDVISFPRLPDTIYQRYINLRDASVYKTNLSYESDFLPKLKDKDYAVAQLVAYGLNNRMIAQALRTNETAVNHALLSFKTAGRQLLNSYLPGGIVTKK